MSDPPKNESTLQPSRAYAYHENSHVLVLGDEERCGSLADGVLKIGRLLHNLHDPTSGETRHHCLEDASRLIGTWCEASVFAHLILASLLLLQQVLTAIFCAESVVSTANLDGRNTVPQPDPESDRQHSRDWDQDSRYC